MAKQDSATSIIDEQSIAYLAKKLGVDESAIGYKSTSPTPFNIFPAHKMRNKGFEIECRDPIPTSMDACTESLADFRIVKLAPDIVARVIDELLKPFVIKMVKEGKEKDGPIPAIERILHPQINPQSGPKVDPRARIIAFQPIPNFHRELKKYVDNHTNLMTTLRQNLVQATYLQDIITSDPTYAKAKVFPDISHHATRAARVYFEDDKVSRAQRAKLRQFFSEKLHVGARLDDITDEKTHKKDAVLTIDLPTRLESDLVKRYANYVLVDSGTIIGDLPHIGAKKDDSGKVERNQLADEYPPDQQGEEPKAPERPRNVRNVNPPQGHVKEQKDRKEGGGGWFGWMRGGDKK